MITDGQSPGHKLIETYHRKIHVRGDSDIDCRCLAACCTYLGMHISLREHTVQYICTYADTVACFLAARHEWAESLDRWARMRAAPSAYPNLITLPKYVAQKCTG
jgi:hypothetical protein